MQKTKIEWTDMTWNPITGCLHGCEYCYARKIARRFSDCKELEINAKSNNISAGAIREPVMRKTKNGDWFKNSYPYGFLPTFHKYRLDEPQKIKKPQTIFVCSMADMFGDWVPDEWIEQVFEACSKAPQHRYLFLTKNAKRYTQILALLVHYFNHEDAPKIWLGSTVTNQNDIPLTNGLIFPTFVSVEPILENVLVENGKAGLPNWIIVGAETGNRKGKVIPKREWVENIVNSCREADVPVFMKDSLADIWQEPLTQEFPWK